MSSSYSKANISIQSGFTIVELLIVIVVIAILAAISIVSYNGITRQASIAALKSDLRNAQSHLEIKMIETGHYPNNSDDFPRSNGTVFDYLTNGSTYCVAASSDAANTGFFLMSTQSAISEGDCSSYDNESGGESPPEEDLDALIASVVSVDNRQGDTVINLNHQPSYWGTASATITKPGGATVTASSFPFTVEKAVASGFSGSFSLTIQVGSESTTVSANRAPGPQLTGMGAWDYVWLGLTASVASYTGGTTTPAWVEVRYIGSSTIDYTVDILGANLTATSSIALISNSDNEFEARLVIGDGRGGVGYTSPFVRAP